MKLAATDRHKLIPLLEQLTAAVEEALLSGLTTASSATIQTINLSFQEASRLRLLRLGSTLRSAGEELGRFTRNDPDFSRKRMSFFLNRAWVLSQGMARALRNNDEAGWEKLLRIPASQPVDRLEVVTLGVVKKEAPAFFAFDFRLRTVGPAGALPAGTALSWSCVYPVKPGLEITAETFLLTNQKQQFKPSSLLEHRTILIEQASVALDESGVGRVGLRDDSRVTQGDPFRDWETFLGWDMEGAWRRTQDYKAGPLDLEVELQEEVVLTDWKVGKPVPRPQENRLVYPVTSGPLELDALVATTNEGKTLRGHLDRLAKLKSKPPLFGLMHYDRCRLVLQPLAALEPNGPEYLMLSKERGGMQELLKTIKF